MKRPFRGLRERPPSPSYDAVVIGSGVAGLVSANLLLRRGLSVLLVEQHYMVGGYCSTFRRGGFTFDASTHFYPLLGNPETLTGRLLAEIGCRTGWVKMDPVDTFHFPDGTRFEVPADLDTYLAQLNAEFPEEREALAGFFAEVREAYMAGLLAYFKDKPTPRFERLAGLTVREVLERRFRDPKLRLLLAADCPHWGSPPGRTSFVFDSMLRLSYFLGNYYPQGGSQAFADDLARCFEEAGGDLLIRSPVRRIRVTPAGEVEGVEIEVHRGQSVSRQTVRTRTVISNADLRLTWQHLVDPADRPAGVLEDLDRLRPTFPCYLMHLGLRGVPDEVLWDAQGYYWDSWDMDRVGRDALRFKIFAPTLYDPAMAPPGGQIVILQKVQELDYGAIPDWTAHKEQIDAFLLGHLERVIPGITEKIVVRTSASAATARRFTWNGQGAMLGWEMSPDQLGENRPAIETPVRGLYLTGHWTRPGGGITPAIVSAQRVAETVARTG